MKFDDLMWVAKQFSRCHRRRYIRICAAYASSGKKYNTFVLTNDHFCMSKYYFGPSNVADYFRT